MSSIPQAIALAVSAEYLAGAGCEEIAQARGMTAYCIRLCLTQTGTATRSKEAAANTRFARRGRSLQYVKPELVAKTYAPPRLPAVREDSFIKPPTRAQLMGGK